MNEAWVKYREWWSQLAVREKQAAALGAALLMIFIAYQWIWTPYLDYIDSMRKQILTNQQNLVWMEQADQTLSKVENQVDNRANTISPMMMLSQIKKQAAEAGLEPNLNELKQVTTDSAAMHFQKVEFDKLIRLLTKMIKEMHINILQMSVTAGNTPGLVSADITLKAG